MKCLNHGGIALPTVCRTNQVVDPFIGVPKSKVHGILLDHA
jgi:hypothetical protein